MNSTEPVILEAVDHHRRGVRISFHWHRDRYAHTVALVDGARLVPLLASREGSTDELWPPSPPLQTLHVEERPDDSQVCLLVGMAGLSHWSLSVEAHTNSTHLAFDAACRIQAPPDMLGSRYRTMVAPSVEDPELLRWRISGLGCQVRAIPIDGDGCAVMQTTPEGLTITANLLEGTSSRTVRWRYDVSWWDAT